MEKLIQEYCEKYQVDGLSLSIMKEGKVVFDFHYHSSNQIRYTIGSVSKTFIAIGILQLVEEGKCSLDNSVSLYIPGFYKEVTIGMLLNHSSGLDCVNFKGKYTNHPYPQYVDLMIERYKHVPLKSRAGKYSVYTNDGFVIAQRLIEILSGLSFHDYLIEKICKPLGMMETTCPNEKMEEGTYKRVTTVFGKQYPQEYVNGIGSGGIYSTAYDLNLLMHSLAAHTLLSKESVDLMTSSHHVSHIHVDTNAGNYGLGLDHVEMPYFKAMGLKAYTKGGATYGYLSNVINIPELDLNLAVVSASNKGNIGLLAREVLGQYLNLPMKKITLKPFTRTIDLGIYGNGNSVYNLYMNDGLVIEEYKEGKFIPKWKLALEGNRFKGEEAFGFKDVELAMYEQNGYSYLILDYKMQVHQRSIFAQKLEEQDIFIDLKPGYYVRNNEYIDQRNMNTQGQLCIYIDSNLYMPYPLKAITQTTAIPYVELPGSYAREMTTLEVNDPTHFTLGFYQYERLEDNKLTSYMIKDDKIHWFKYNNEKVDVGDQVRIIGLDSKGNYVYDSYLSSDSFKGDYIGILGVENEEVKVS